MEKKKQTAALRRYRSPPACLFLFVTIFPVLKTATVTVVWRQEQNVQGHGHPLKYVNLSQ